MKKNEAYIIDDAIRIGEIYRVCGTMQNEDTLILQYQNAKRYLSRYRWFETFDSAKKEAIELRKKRIDDLKKEIDRLNRLEFTEIEYDTTQENL